MNRRFVICSVAALGLHAAAAFAQQDVATVRSFELAGLQQAAIDTDPRLQQLPLLRMQSELRQRNISALRLPAITVDVLGQYQSDVPHLTTTVEGIVPLFLVPKDTYDGSVHIDQRIFDATVHAESALEVALLAENQARVRTTLFTLRQQVNDAFFGAAVIQAREGALNATIAELMTRLQETNARVMEGTAIPADAAAIEATLLERQQDADELRANRRAALDRLATLTGQAVGDDDVLALPDLTDAVARARQTPGALRARPEYDEFARTRERLARQRDATAAQDRPRISTFAQVGYGKPGLNFLNNQFESYGLGGVRLQWNAWSWGSSSREREALGIQQQVVTADEAAFSKGLTTSIEGDQATVDRLRRSLTADQRIVLLREQVERSTQLRLQEGVVTASEYLDRSAELLQARFARAGHEVDLAQASARLLTTLGLEVR